MDDYKTYEQGLADSWEAARKIADLPYHKHPDVFGTGIHGYGAIIQHFTPAEAIAKIKACEDRQDEIKVGDEITDGKRKCVVVEKYNDDTGFNQSHLYALDSSGRCFSIYKHNFVLYWKKTGKHFPQVEELLKAMRQESTQEG